MKNQDLDAFSSSYKEQASFHDENRTMLGWYAQRIMQHIAAKKYRSVLSLGIGHQVLPRAILGGLGDKLERYAVIEGSLEIIETFRLQMALPAHTELIHSFFEDFQAAEKFEAIEMGFVLEHVDDPAAMLHQYARFVSPCGTLYIAVPNARSLHRLIGREAGLLDNLYRLSPDDLRFGHQRYFDLESITQLVLGAGLKIVNVEGILLKPLTTGQLRSLNLSQEVVNGLLKVGVGFPGICNGILLEATP